MTLAYHVYMIYAHVHLYTMPSCLLRNQTPHVRKPETPNFRVSATKRCHFCIHFCNKNRPFLCPFCDRCITPHARVVTWLASARAFAHTYMIRRRLQSTYIRMMQMCVCACGVLCTCDTVFTNRTKRRPFCVHF